VNPIAYLETGVLVCGDNLEQLASFPDECVDLIYLDPPFFSNRQYEVIWGDEAEVRSFEDRWQGGIQHYIGWMRDRALHLHRLLKPTGSLYLHCDPSASHYLKVMLDGIFGQALFRNEIIWKRSSAHSSARRFGPVHDTLLFYTKGDDYVWHKAWQPLPQETIDKWYNNVEPDTGRRFNRADLTAAGVRSGPSGAPWRGIDPSTKGRHWAIPGFVGKIVEGKETAAALDALDEAGRLFWPKRAGGIPMLKRYVEESRGIPAQDVITYISPLNNVAAERLGYPTQKPEALLRVLVAASSNPGDIILDPFCGCGTTLAVAQQLNRRWVGIDISPTAINLIERRLRKVGAQTVKSIGLPRTVEDLRTLKPFEFQNWVVQQVNGTHAPRKSGDKGIDGFSFFERLPLQVKQSDRVGRNVVDNFETAIRRTDKHKGFIFAFSFTRGAYEETARARQDGLEIELVTIDVLTGERKVEQPKLGSLLDDIWRGMLEAKRAAYGSRPDLSADDLVASERALSVSGD
jgi:DNA modification methylase